MQKHQQICTKKGLSQRRLN